MFLLFVFQFLSFGQDSIFLISSDNIKKFATLVDTNFTTKDIFITLKKNNYETDNSIIIRKINKENTFSICTQNFNNGQIPNFRSFELFSKNALLIKSDTGSGLMSTQGKQLSKFYYSEIKNENAILLAKRENSIVLFPITKGHPNTKLMAVDNIEGISKNLFISNKSSKFGVYDCSKSRYIIAPDFDDIKFSKNCFIVEKNNKKGLFDIQGKQIVPLMYDKILPDTLNYFKTCNTNVSSHQQLENLKFVDDKWGLVDGNGKIIIPNEFVDIGKYALGYFAVKKSDFFEFYSTNDNIIVAIKFKNILPTNKKFAPVQVGFYWGVINDMLQWKIPPSYSEILPISDSIWILKKSKNMSFYLPYKNEIISPSYEEIITTSGGYFKIINNGLIGLLSPKLQPIIPAIYTKIKVFEKDNIILTNKLNYYSIFYMNGNLKVRMHYTFEKYLDYVEGLAQVQHKGKWGFVNTDGQIVVSTQYDECKDFSNGKAEVRIGNKWGYVSATEKLIVSPYYDETKKYNIGSGCVRKGTFWGFVDALGKEVYKPQFESVKETNSNKYIVYKNGKKGIFDENGIELMSLFYKDCEELMPNYYKTRLFGKYGLVDAKNNKIIDFLYDNITWDEKLQSFVLYKIGDWQALK